MATLPNLRKLDSLQRRLRYTVKKGIKMPVSEDVGYYVRCTKRLAVDSRIVLYEAHHGAGLTCNPRAIFHALLADPRHAGLSHVWVVDGAEELARLSHQYRGHRNVRFIRRNSRPYLRALATAGYLIQNTSFPAYFFKRAGQVYVNTWHSTTVKTLGYDIPGGNFGSRNMVRNLLMADYVLSPNPFMTGIFRNSFRLQGLFPGTMLEFGYPRNDTTLSARRQEVVARLRSRGVHVDPDKAIVLYAPTWRGESVTSVDGNTDALDSFRATLEARIDTSKYQVLIKPHQYHFRAMSAAERSSGRYVPREVDANELLAAVDVLISDYSSIFLDYLTVDRPILFYLPDKAEYQASRGLYFELDDLPGPASADPDEVAGWINDLETVADDYRAARARTRQWACPHDDGKVAERVVDAVFGGNLSQPGVLRDFIDPQRRRVLLYGAGFGANGVTAALLALLAQWDHSRYDLTVAGIVSGGDSARNFEKLQGVRALARTGTFAVTRWETFGIQYAKRYGLNGPLVRVFRPQVALKREFDRWFGSADFDYIIDYSGYGSLFPCVFRQHQGSVKIIWQHADLMAELTNKEKRRLPQYRGNPVTKTALMNTYAAFDKVVACGAALREVNLRSLGSPATRHKFGHANNVIDADRVRRLAAVESLIDFHGPKVAADDAVQPDGSRRLHLVPLDPPAPGSGEPFLKFVTMGRLSPEKNHERLIRGFALFVAEHPNSRLYIIGGGPLENPLRRLVERLGLAAVVTLTGALENPFSLIKHCDCFVLPSLHEGYGLVISEVRMLGLPIVLSRFEVVDSSCLPEGQYLVGFTPEELRDGLEAFRQGRVPADYRFDVDAHNAAAVAQFESLLG